MPTIDFHRASPTIRAFGIWLVTILSAAELSDFFGSESHGVTVRPRGGNAAVSLNSNAVVRCASLPIGAPP
jgi:hypothetical protein